MACQHFDCMLEKGLPLPDWVSEAGEISTMVNKTLPVDEDLDLSVAAKLRSFQEKQSSRKLVKK